MTTAPILLFTYKRLATLKQTVAALRANRLAPQSDLYIFSDQGKTSEDMAKVAEVRQFIQTIDGFRNVYITQNVTNKGLASSIIGGVSQVIQQYGRVIVLEDDLLTTPNFLDFMNAALEKYERDHRVFSISGYSFDLGPEDPERYPFDAYFTSRGWSWGWATWKDRWSGVDWQMKDYPEFARNAVRRRQFAQGGSDLILMLRRQMSGQLDSWAIRWFYHQFKVQGLTLYPILSKIYNDGFDDMATHTRGSNARYQPRLDTKLQYSFPMLPDAAADSSYWQKRFQRKLGITARIVSKYQTFISNLLK
ncbi:MAG: glycosyltransferase [Bacteroidetes bacterium]|nr:glycosyltransferase [Bacteroidota bacterium]